MVVWGLTGNIACGKSLVERFLRDEGVPVIDADRVARDIVAPGQAALLEIGTSWPEVVRQDGTLHREKLGAIVFADPVARRRLEAITHPRIAERIAFELAALANAGGTIAVVSAALMVESGSYRNYAGLAVVTAPLAAQRARLMARDGLTEDAANARIRAQLEPGKKIALANVVIDNGGDEAATRTQVAAWVQAMRG
jgi:dephospho-CoA kinase